MPLQQCKQNGVSGWKWGSSGHCYTGSGAKKKAIKQGLAEGDGTLKASAEMSQAEIDEAAEEVIRFGFEDESYGDKFVDAASAYISKKSRDKTPKEDFGWPEEEKYPVRNQKELDAAVKLIGRAPKDKQDAIKKRIKEIAKRKGLKLPDRWQD